ncbi:pullulanase [Pontibacter ummariensis]|uniref:Pullulanase n=1 Tax=Pontibacter ummariensis TaxID=1610492 RepID=A0A239KZE8_9BACT|nr:type I pullulanase [Pontibacter ummariensis]PRY04643.1 pullulanase [Pontibacter ummariensis]SNT23440.1 pullulanase [Pontibacter ummariensis]
MMLMLKLSFLLLMATTTALFSGKDRHYHKNYDAYPTAPDASLWLAYSPQQTTFSLWSPVAEEVKVNLYEQGEGGKQLGQHPLLKENNGLRKLSLDQDLQGTYYTYQVKVNGHWLQETPGIYATAVGVNGKRAMVLDLATTDPEGWQQDKGPAVDKPNEVIIYEAHVRDITSSPSSGSSKPGKFLGLVENGTTTKEGLTTGIDHMKELGITHVHLLPSFDFRSVDEAALDKPQFNWGYDPQNYNVPEGSYSSDPYQAEVRIKEFKQMVQGFHQNGIGVVLDVVYNHTGETEHSNFNLEVPGYYYRHTPEGKWSDASACGNETASERAMMRKYIIESCKFWAKEYHIDGFRFDLMGIHDVETMNQLTEELKKINPNIFVYGEGWTAGKSPLPDKEKALKANTYKLKSVAAFSDDIRDGLKGSVFEEKSRGFVSGAKDTEESVKFGVVGSIKHPQVNYTKINYSKAPWANEPWQSVSYVSCHDNHTLFDKLKISCKGASKEELKKMHMLSNAVVLTSQGIPFLHAGVELLRTKNGEHNSYNLPDSVNQINWAWKAENKEVFDYYKGLITLRKAHPAFRMPSADMVNKHLHFTVSEPGLIGYQIRDHAHNDKWKNIRVYYNARKSPAAIKLDGAWQVSVSGQDIDLKGSRTVKDKVVVPPVSMLVLFQE